MSHSELLLEKHAKTFIDPKHERKAARGILFDGEGAAYATDAIQALKVGGLPEVGFPWAQTLKGKVIEDTFDNMLHVMQSSFTKELTSAGEISVYDFRSAADQLLTIQKIDEKSLEVKDRGTYKVYIANKDGKLSLEFTGNEVDGKVEIAEDLYGGDFTLMVNCKRLLECLSVFDSETVRLLHGNHVLRFEAKGIATLLLPYGYE